MTQERLADRADLDVTLIRGLERGVGNPSRAAVDRIARALGLALHALARKVDELETTERRPTDEPLDSQS